MNNFRTILAVSACAVGALLPAGGFAQATMDPSAMTTPQSAAMTEGEVRKVDLQSAKITIKHGEIKHLEMPGMTMAFPVKDKSLLATVKPGDKIKFMVAKEGGKLVVTGIQPMP